jgi:hypothetical protein
MRRLQERWYLEQVTLSKVDENFQLCGLDWGGRSFRLQAGREI